MTEYRFVNFRRPASALIPPTTEDIKVLTIDFAGSNPELAESMDGWEAVNFQVLPVENDVILTVLLRTTVSAEGLLGEN